MNIFDPQTEQQTSNGPILTEHFGNVTDNELKEAIEKRIPENTQKHCVWVIIFGCSSVKPIILRKY